MTHQTPMPGTQAPAIEAKDASGQPFHLPASAGAKMSVVFFYRGVHCPICKTQIEELSKRQGDFRELGVDVAAVSMDDDDRFARQQSEWDLGDLPVGHAMSEASAREWGLFISDKAQDSEPARFAEPGIAVMYPDGRIYSLYYQNVPFARPTLDDLVKGLGFILKKDYPIRGTA
ncbi:redoxin domain-containing protein [Paracoccus sp. 1_MG-2023]|uniref:redoxin domain-containing protein n=1 Tax=unclassified Paracoccus (in: a-proteobacteria) TaxID=2688777 RepID=UPI001C095FB3|nr:MULTISPECIES: redoxin domain-containing protein [unclassified Paracoccus (in: a-proteobacteria)]MBU2956094.1 redoxin domain-containing protein [Paracoccus sp. C2R09]MDO6669500.1 redoxin domain-containing protein [Paracoccus sp. 1_MG-2023]